MELRDQVTRIEHLLMLSDFGHFAAIDSLLGSAKSQHAHATRAQPHIEPQLEKGSASLHDAADHSDAVKVGSPIDLSSTASPVNKCTVFDLYDVDDKYETPSCWTKG